MRLAQLGLLQSQRASAFVPSSDSLAMFANYTGGNALTLNEQIAWDRFINWQVLIGNWSKIYKLLPMVGMDSAAKSLICAKTGTSATLSTTAPTYSATTGWTTNGTSSYIKTGIIPSTANGGSTVPLNDTSYSMHVIENLGYAIMGVIGTTATGQMVIGVNSSGVAGNKHHSDNSISWTDATYLGRSQDFYSQGRESSSTVRFYSDCQQEHLNSSYTSKNVPAGREIYVGARNNNGTADSFGASRYGMVMLWQQSGFNYTGFFAGWEILMQELGVQTKSSLYPVDLSVKSYLSTETVLVNAEGQSNSLFAGAATSLDTELQGAKTNIKVLWRNPFTNPLTIENLQWGVTNSYDTGGLSNRAGGMRMAYELQRKLGIDIYLWQYGISGTALFQNGAGSDWYPDSSVELYYDSHTRLATPGIPLVQSAKTIKKIIFHWGQGEADAASSRTQAQYTADFYYYLKKKIDFLEGLGINFATIPLHVIIQKIWSGLATGGHPTKDDIRAAQASFSKTNFNTAYAGYGDKVASFTIYDNDRSIHTDGVHMDYHAYDIEGYRLAFYMARL
jgi:hypothetical protein